MRAFTIGAWSVRPPANEVVRGEEVVRLEPKVMDLLLALAARGGEVRTRGDLLDEVWPEAVVTEDALNATVSKLRRALGDDPQRPRYVETIPRRGYRLIPQVVFDEEPPPSPARPREPASPPPTLHQGWLLGLLAGLVVLGLGLVWLWPSLPPMASSYAVHPLTVALGIERDPALGPDGQVVYAARAQTSDTYDLYVQHPDGTAQLTLTNSEADDRFPAWRPDGRYVAFLRCEQLACGLYTVTALGGPARQVHPGPFGPYGLAWTPEGLVAAWRSTPDAPYQLVQVPSDPQATLTLEPLTIPSEGLGDLFPAHDLESQRLTFLRYPGGQAWVLTPGAGPAQPVSSPAPVEAVTWAASGEGLLVTHSTDLASQLWHVPLTDAPPEPLGVSVSRLGRVAAAPERTVAESWTVEANLWQWAPETSTGPQAAVMSTAIDREPALAPDGTALAFISDRTGTPALWVATLGATQPLRLAPSGVGATAGAPAWSPDGQQIAYEQVHGEQADLYVVSAQGGTARRLTDEGYNVAPRWSPDGQWLYYGSNRSGAWEVWKVAATGGVPTQVTSGGGFAAQEGSDGQIYLVRHLEDGLWRHNPATGTTERVLDDLRAFDWGSWHVLQDGRIVYIQRGPDVDWLAVRHLDGTTSRLRQVEAMPSRAPALTATPDGRQLAWSTWSRAEADLVQLVPTVR